MFDDNIPSNSNSTPTNLPLDDSDDIFDAVDDNTSEMNPPDLEMAVPNYPIEEELLVNNNSVSSANPTMPTTASSALEVGILKPKMEENMTPSRPPVEDMFSEPNTIAPVYNDENVLANQIFDTSSSINSQPSYQTVLPPPGMNGSDANRNNQNNSQLSEPVGNKKVIIWIVLLVVVLILGSGSAWIYFSFIKNANTNNNFVDVDNSVGNEKVVVPIGNTRVVEETVVTNTNTSEDTTSTMDLNQEIIIGEPLDTDADGLDDIKETSLGTDPLVWDTDGDNLSDSDEVLIWKTDPLNPDTDGDGYDDGAEIKNGYSPVGSGKLFEVPTTTGASTTSTNL
jgi:hypothetical protein